MYRIRSGAGAELVYNSLEEFTLAVRRGEVDPEDQIFHTRANRWLDVKSHPHYRSALSWQGGSAPVPVSASAAPTPAPVAPTPAPRPAQAPRPASAQAPQSSSSSKAQVFERPVLRPTPQTTVRPQLQPAAAPRAEAPAPAPVVAAKVEAPAATPANFGPPAKSKEITFVDLGDAGQAARLKAAVLESERPAAPVKPQPKPEPKPVPKPAAVPDSELEFLVMDGGIESPVRTSAGYKTVPEDMDLLFEAPLPENGKSGAPVVVGAPSAKPLMGPKSGKTPAVNLVPPAPKVDAVTDLDIPGGALLQPPAVAPAPAPSTEDNSQPKAVYLASGMAILALAGALLAWRPWSGPSSSQNLVAANQPSPPPPSLVTTASATTSPANILTGKPGVAIPGPAAGNPKPIDPKAVPAVAVADSEENDGVIAAATPVFKTDISLSAGDISLGEPVRAGTPSAISPIELTHRMEFAQQLAQRELGSRLMSAGFRTVLSPDRLNSHNEVTNALSAWNAGADAIRQYRAKIARIEKAYEDSVLSAQRAQRWSSEEMRSWATRKSLAEPAETGQLADLMFSQVTEGLEILSALGGEYTIQGNVISFKNTASATRYASIRGWVEQRMAGWASTPESARPYSISAILRALDDGFPVVK